MPDVKKCEAARDCQQEVKLKSPPASGFMNLQKESIINL